MDSFRFIILVRDTRYRWKFVIDERVVLEFVGWIYVDWNGIFDSMMWGFNSLMYKWGNIIKYT